MQGDISVVLYAVLTIGATIIVGIALEIERAIKKAVKDKTPQYTAPVRRPDESDAAYRNRLIAGFRHQPSNIPPLPRHESAMIWRELAEKEEREREARNAEADTLHPLYPMAD